MHKDSHVIRCRAGKLVSDICHLVCERQVAIYANGEPLVTLLCSGDSLWELTYGFLYNEGVIASAEDVESCAISEDGSGVEVSLSVPVTLPACPVISSGLGGRTLTSPVTDVPGCAGAGLGRFMEPMDRQMRERELCEYVQLLSRAVCEMSDNAREYAIAGGIHCSALFVRGTMLAAFEDIGRHNTIDKLAGHCLLHGRSPQGALLTTTGRISAEMLRKAMKMGVSAVASLSAPTDAAAKLAEEAGILLAGYVREDSLIVYTGIDPMGGYRSPAAAGK